MSKKDDFPVYASLVDGLNKYNLEVEYYDKSTNLETVLQDNKNTHLFIGISLYKYTFNLNNTKSKKLFQDSNANFLSIEYGYGTHRTIPRPKDRCKYPFGFPYNGMNGEATFLRPASYNKQKDTTKQEIKPWRSENEGEYVLICQQRDFDRALKSKNLKEVNMSKWTIEQVQKYESLGYKVRVRSPLKFPIPESQKNTLQEDFDNAKIVVTCSSNCGVLSVLQGIPTVATHPISMVYDICKNTKTPDRVQWLKNLSYTHWTLEEITNGAPWEFLKKTKLGSNNPRTLFNL